MLGSLGRKVFSAKCIVGVIIFVRFQIKVRNIKIRQRHRIWLFFQWGLDVDAETGRVHAWDAMRNSYVTHRHGRWHVRHHLLNPRVCLVDRLRDLALDVTAESNDTRILLSLLAILIAANNPFCIVRGCGWWETLAMLVSSGFIAAKADKRHGFVNAALSWLHIHTTPVSNVVVGLSNSPLPHRVSKVCLQWIYEMMLMMREKMTIQALLQKSFDGWARGGQ